MSLSVQSAGLALPLRLLLCNVCVPDVNTTSVVIVFRDCLGVCPALLCLLLFWVHILLCVVASMTRVSGSSSVDVVVLGCIMFGSLFSSCFLVRCLVYLGNLAAIQGLLPFALVLLQ